MYPNLAGQPLESHLNFDHQPCPPKYDIMTIDLDG